MLIVFLSSSTSPLTSTVTFFERSPFATAVVTSAMLRTCSVSESAMPFTDSVSPRHVPLTPSTCAWPPSLPSVPTSRATRVTSAAKAESWSTIVLIVSLSSAISPWTSTVIFFVRSPFATAVVTCAMLRTCVVRLPASVLTLSVRSFQTPLTPSTFAWPPRRPSVPTSRATRVTSAENARSWSTIVLIVSLSCSTSPRTSTVIFFERSPVATAVVTSAMLRTWSVRLPASVLTLSVRSFQTPLTPSTFAWPPSLPSVPTSFATRVTSAENARSWSTIVLTVSFSSSTSPLTSTVIFFERSPFATAVVTAAMFRTCVVRFDARPFTDSVRSFHVPLTPLTCAWPPSLPSSPTSRATRVTSSANDGELVDHRVDRVLQLGDLAAHVDGDLLREVAVRDCGRDLRDVAHLRREVAGERVDVVGEVLPDAGDALHARLAAELAVGADLARDARDLVGERGELVDHRVHGRADAAELALHGLPLDRQLHLLGEVAVGDCVDHARDLGRGADEVVDQRVERRCRVGPVPGGGRGVRALGQAALAADGAADAGDFLAERLAAVGELVEGAVEVGGDALAGNGEADAEVAVAGGLERGEQLLELVPPGPAVSAPFFAAFAPFCACEPARLRGRAALPCSASCPTATWCPRSAD